MTTPFPLKGKKINVFSDDLTSLMSYIRTASWCEAVEQGVEAGLEVVRRIDSPAVEGQGEVLMKKIMGTMLLAQGLVAGWGRAAEFEPFWAAWHARMPVSYSGAIMGLADFRTQHIVAHMGSDELDQIADQACGRLTDQQAEVLLEVWVSSGRAHVPRALVARVAAMALEAEVGGRGRDAPRAHM